VDVRFIAATNARIEELVDEGVFRADLHFRLNVLPLAVPPLRARRGDILPLARHFLRKHAPDDGRHRELSSCATAALLAYDWPGNVRELESAIIRALHLAPSEQIQPADFHLPMCTNGGSNGRAARTNGGPALTGEPSFQQLKQDVLSAFERDYLRQLLDRHNGNVTRAARAAGKERRALGKLLRKHRIDPNEFAAAS
jgi:DNA-binding NtrC family response regulator